MTHESEHGALPASSQTLPAARPLSAAMILARDAANGDVIATRKLLEMVAPRMMRVVQLVLGGGHPDVDDVLQQSLIALVQALPNFRGECEPASYGSRIAVRSAVLARKRTRIAYARHDDRSDADALPAPTASPADLAMSSRRREVLRQLLDEIPEEQAESLALRFMLGWSLQEVADATSAPVNTVRSRVRLAKEALRKRIEQTPGLLDALLPEDEGRRSIAASGRADEGDDL